jgi:hypothetical protein
MNEFNQAKYYLKGRYHFIKDDRIPKVYYLILILAGLVCLATGL